jgi:adenylate kinase
MKIILLGSIGAGKGTQAKLLATKFDIPHIATGDIFRTHIKNETEIGKKVKSILDSGGYVDDTLTVSIVSNRLAADCEKGFILDGFPRNENQAMELEKIIAIDKVIYINVHREIIIKRLTGRISCINCGAMYHNQGNKPKNENTCDVCGDQLVQREDDKESVVKKRLEIFEEQTAPLVEYYESKGLLTEVDGIGTIEEIAARILKEVQI